MPLLETAAHDHPVNPASDPRRRDPAGTPERAFALRWQYILPAAIVAGIIVAAVTIQPSGPPASAGQLEGMAPATSTVAPSPTSAVPTPEPTLPLASATTSSSRTPGPSVNETSPGEAVAGAIQTPSATVTTVAPTPDLSGGMEQAQCGLIQEASVPLAVEQNLAGVAIRATNAAVYPIEYLRCILLATGGSDAVTLANAIAEAGRAGSTHAALVDLWASNGNRDFAQLNLRDAEVISAGGTTGALGVLNGRGDIVIASGQARTVTLVATMTVTYGATPGPITLSIEAPLIGGTATKGKYQLFLPTP